jgi:hypothetical protein
MVLPGVDDEEGVQAYARELQTARPKKDNSAGSGEYGHTGCQAAVGDNLPAYPVTHSSDHTLHCRIRPDAAVSQESPLEGCDEAQHLGSAKDRQVLHSRRDHKPSHSRRATQRRPPQSGR